MSSSSMHDRAIVLELVGHGGALNEDASYGGAPHRRYINVTGRWSAAGTPEVPLIRWSTAEAASDARAVAAAARKRQMAVSDLSMTDPGCFVLFDERLVVALQGYLPYAAAAAKKLEALREKTMRYASIVLAPARSPELISAAQFMTGKKAQDITTRVLDGELVCTSGLTPDRLVLAGVRAEELVSKLGGAR